MEISRMLNHDDGEGRERWRALPPPPPRPRCSSSSEATEQFRSSRCFYNANTTSPTTTTTPPNTHSSHHYRRLQLTPLESALPELSRSVSDDSADDSLRSPLLTPDPPTPLQIPQLPFQRNHKRHDTASEHSFPLPLLHALPPLHRTTSTASSVLSLSPSMDFPNSRHDVGYDNNMMLNYPSNNHLTTTSTTGPTPHFHQLQPQLHSISTDQASSSSSSFPSTATQTPARTAQRKNSYPCPVAKQYNCSEHFTTSGHAARHAKKHTGRKDAICPECGKAFTRKDNMEQHRRTHGPGRANAKSSSSSAAQHTNDEAKQQRKQLKIQQQQSQQHQKNSRSLSGLSSTSGELSNPSMPANIVSPMPQPVVIDSTHTPAVDPQLNTSNVPFDPKSPHFMSSWNNMAQMSPYNNMNSSYAVSTTPSNASRPKLERSGFVNASQHQSKPSFSSRSHSSISTDTSSESNTASSALEELANAASRHFGVGS